MKVNLSQMKDFTPPSEGSYVGTITSVEEGKTHSGFPKIDVKWEVEEEGVAKTVFQTVALGGEGAFRAYQLFISVGMADTKEEVDGLEFESEDLVGLQALLKIKHRVWTEEEGGDGSVRGKVASMKRVETGAKGSGSGGLFGRGRG